MESNGELLLPSPIQKLQSRLLENKNVSVYVKREDLIHPLLGGNKWRKLKYNLLYAKKIKQETLLTFGGAYSNHVFALAAAGKILGFNTIGIIRGDAHIALNPTLTFAKSQGMQLHFIDRESYRNKNNHDFIQELKDKFGKFYLIPEGGSNELALPGCQEIMHELEQQIPEPVNHVCVACGTGGTLAGLISSGYRSKYLGVAVLKNAGFLKQAVQLLLPKKYDHWSIELDYHFGGYARTQLELMAFITKFREEFDIQLEPVYTGKLFYAVFEMIEKNYFKPGASVVLMHTGGLQNGLQIPQVKNFYDFGN